MALSLEDMRSSPRLLSAMCQNPNTRMSIGIDGETSQVGASALAGIHPMAHGFQWVSGPKNTPLKPLEPHTIVHITEHITYGT